MHTLQQDVASMGREADVVLFLKITQAEEVLQQARIYTACWVNHVNPLTFLWRSGEHKTSAPPVTMTSDNSAVTIYNLLLSAGVQFYTEMIITPTVLLKQLSNQSHIGTDPAKYQEMIAQDGKISFPTLSLFLKHPNSGYPHALIYSRLLSNSSDDSVLCQIEQEGAPKFEKFERASLKIDKGRYANNAAEANNSDNKKAPKV